MEEYKTIEGYEHYEVSNLGNVRNKTTGKILKQSLKNRYCEVLLSKNLKKKMFFVHHLVATAFIPNPESTSCVVHINRIKRDNKFENLKWFSKTCTGVYYDKSRDKWKVRIAINGKKKHIGYYQTFDEAVKVRKEQEAIHYKEFQAFQSEMEQLEYEFEQLIK